jgi:hypothetical protein
MRILMHCNLKQTEQLRGDISTTERAPYPQAHEINIPRVRMME